MKSEEDREGRAAERDEKREKLRILRGHIDRLLMIYDGLEREIREEGKKSDD
jgi:hypothetical protein